MTRGLMLEKTACLMCNQKVEGQLPKKCEEIKKLWKDEQLSLDFLSSHVKDLLTLKCQAE